MSFENTSWWLLQIQFPDKHGKQRGLNSEPMSRSALVSSTVELIPWKIRIKKESTTWGFADLTKVSNNLYSFYLTGKPPHARIDEEPEHGHLDDSIDARYARSAK